MRQFQRRAAAELPQCRPRKEQKSHKCGNRVPRQPEHQSAPQSSEHERFAGLDRYPPEIQLGAEFLQCRLNQLLLTDRDATGYHDHIAIPRQLEALQVRFLRIRHNIKDLSNRSGTGNEIGKHYSVCFVNLARTDRFALRTEFAPGRENRNSRTPKDWQFAQTLRGNRGKLRSPEDTSSRCYLLAFAKVTATYPNVFPATDAIAYEDNSIEQVGILLHEHGIRMSRYRRASIDPNRLASGDAQSKIRPSGLLSTDHEPCASNRVLSPNRIPVHRRVIEPRQRHAGNDVMGKNSVSTFPNRHIFDSRRLHRL